MERDVSIIRRSWPGWVAVVSIWALYALTTAHTISRLAKRTGDSDAYLAMASYRPPVYGWFLHEYHWLTGGLDCLPIVQLSLVSAGLLIFSIQLGLLLRSALVSAMAMLLIACHPGVHQSPLWLMSESVFETLFLVGLGLQIRFVRLGGIASLACAVGCFAFAAGTRTSGMIFLFIPLLTAVFDNRVSTGKSVARAALAALTAAVILLSMMAANWERDGHFEIGSWTGVSLLGKGLLLLEPTDGAGLPPPVAATAPAAASLRELINEQPDLAARLRAQDQAYQDLRFPLFYPDAERTWKAWAEGDWQARGELALRLSERVIANHKLGFLRLWANDWMALVLYPSYWPRWATSDADGTLFPACRLHNNCWVLTRTDAPLRTSIALLAVSVIGTVGGLLVIVSRTWRVVRRIADPSTVFFWASALVLQLNLLGVSAFEAGLVRYTDVSHILGVALLLWFASLLPIHVLADRWLGGGLRRLASREHGGLMFSCLHGVGILLGVALFLLCVSTNALLSIDILFYRGLVLILLAALLQTALLGGAIWRVRRRYPGFSFGIAHLAPIILTTTALNLAFFVLIPVNIDRSMSVFLLAWMDDHRDTPQTRGDLARALQQVYFDDYGGIDRRIAEQLASGDITASGKGYVLTRRGDEFVDLARQISRLFSTDPRIVHPLDTLTTETIGRDKAGPLVESERR